MRTVNLRAHSWYIRHGGQALGAILESLEDRINDGVQRRNGAHPFQFICANHASGGPWNVS